MVLVCQAVDFVYNVNNKACFRFYLRKFNGLNKQIFKKGL